MGVLSTALSTKKANANIAQNSVQSTAAKTGGVLASALKGTLNKEDLKTTDYNKSGLKIGKTQTYDDIINKLSGKKSSTSEIATPSAPQTIKPKTAKATTPTLLNPNLLISKMSYPTQDKLDTAVVKDIQSNNDTFHTNVPKPKTETTGFDRVVYTANSGLKSAAGGTINAIEMLGKSPVNLPFYALEQYNNLVSPTLNKAKDKLFTNTAEKLLDSSANDIAAAKEGASGLGKFAVDAGSGATQLAVDVGIGALTGGGTIVPMALQAFGSGAYEAKKAGASVDKQVLYGDLQGTATGMVEGLFNVGGALTKIFGKGALDDVLGSAMSKAINRFATSEAGKLVVSKLATGVIAGLGEGFENIVQDALTPVFQKLTYDKDAQWNAESILYDALQGVALGGLLGTAGKPMTDTAQSVTENVQNVPQNVQNNVQPKTVAVDTMQPKSIAPKIDTNVNALVPNIGKTAQNIAQDAPQSPTINESAKDVKLPANEENVTQGQETKPEQKTPQENQIYIDERDYKNVSPRKVKAFQFDNPELHENYAQAAKGLLQDLSTSTKGERWALKDEDGYFVGSDGVKRSVSKPIEKLLDNADLRRDQITKALNDIIADHGQENYAAAKKVELILDEMLTDGFEVEGNYIEPDSDYIAKKEAIKNNTDYRMTEEEWNAIMSTEPQETAVSNPLSPSNPLVAKITKGMPQGTGAMSRQFPVIDVQNQQNSTNTAFTPEERQIEGLRNEDSTHVKATDVEAMSKAQERLDFDFEGEKADLPNKQDWDKADTTTAQLILRKLTGKARKSGDYSEVIKWNKTVESHKSAQGVALQANKQFANTPAEIISEAAVTLSNIEAEEKGKTRTSKQIVEDDKAKEQSNDVGKAVHEATKETANKMSKSYSNHTKKARLPRLKTIEGNQAGEPFTFEYEEKVGETLANSIEKSLSSKPKQTTFLKEIASQLKAFAKETMPEKAKSTNTKITATDRLNDYLANKEFYSNAWSLAQDELRRRYANNPDMLAELEDFTNSTIGFRGNPSDRNSIMIRSLVNSAIESGETKQVLRLQEALGFTKTADNIANDLIKRTGATGEDAEIIRSAASQYVNDVLATSELDATKTVNAKVKSAMHDIGLTISETVTKSAKQKASVSEAVTKLLVNKYGIGSSDATNVAKVVTEHFNTMVNEATQKKLESIFNKTKTTPNIKPYMQKLTEMMNMGVFDNSKYSEAAAEKLFGLKVEESGITSEKFKSLMKTISEKADTLNNIKKGDTASTIKLIKELNTIRKTAGMFTDKTSKFMSNSLDYVAKNSEDADAFLRDVATTQIRNIASDYQKTSTLEAVKSVRFMNVLSKIATLARNLTSNFVIDPVDSIAGNAVVPIDMLLSKYTGTRSTPIDKSWLSDAKRKGSVEGFYKSAIQVGLDADVTGDTSKNETHTGRTFKMTGNVVERFLSTWDKYEKYGLQSTDEFTKGGISAESQRGIDVLKSKGLVAKDALLDRPMEIAKQRTLQNDGMTAKALGKVKEGFNVAKLTDKQGGTFGLGDLGFMFTKIPANATAMAANYTPAGLIKATTNLVKTLKQAHNGTLTADQQAKAVTDLGRALSGTAGVAMFTGLAIKGLIRVLGDDDKDKEALQKSEGQSGTQFNLSATMRYLTGGGVEWKSDDAIMSIGFLEQINGQMIMGSMLADAYKEDGTITTGDVVSSNAAAILQAVMDLPAISQIASLSDGYRYSRADTVGGKLADAGGSFLASQVSSFLVPNIVAGVAQGIDNTQRNTYSSDKWYNNAKDSVLSKIPFARNTLPAKITPMGAESKTTDKPILNMLNSSIFPGAIGTYKTSEVNQELYRLDKVVDNVKYPARNAPNSISSGDNLYSLSAEEKAKYQKTAGQYTYDLMQSMIDNDAYDKMTNEQKAATVSKIMGYAQDMAKREYFKSQAKPYTSSDFEKAYQASKKGIDVDEYYAYENYLKKIDTNGSPTQVEYAKAIDETDLENTYKGKLWQIQNSKADASKNPFTGTLAMSGVKPENVIDVMDYADTAEADKNAAGKSISGSKKNKVIAYAESKGYSREQINALCVALGYTPVY